MREDVRKILVESLRSIEPDYQFLATHGDDALVVIEELIMGDEAKMAQRAVLLAAEIGTPKSLEIVVRCSQDPRFEVRAASVLSAAVLPRTEGLSVVSKALEDENPSIRKLAADMALQTLSTEFMKKLESMSKSDPDEFVREVCKANCREFQSGDNGD